MPLNTAVAASIIESSYQTMIVEGLSFKTSYTSAWSDAYEAYSSTGICTISKDPGPGDVIGSTLLSMDDYSVANIDKLAQGFADYWSNSHLTPKSPAVSISGNDASTKVNDFKLAIISAVTQELKTPPFKHLFDACDPVVKSIIWFGTNSSGNPITGTIS